MRGIYYVCREIASQQEREFRNQNYNDIKKVYSIWIVMNSPADSMNHIRLKSDDILGTSRWKPMYEILNVIIVRIKKKTAGKENKPLQVIADELEEDVQKVQSLYDACKLYMPDYNFVF